MAVISEEQLQFIRSSVDIIDVVGSYLPLAPKGKNYFGVCPFHDDHSPSMSVSKEKQIYTCFSCGASGNVFQFVMNYEHISFPEAVKVLADKASITMDIKSTLNKPIIKKYQTLYDIYQISNKVYQNNLQTKAGIKAKEYLISRGIDEAIMKRFEIGLAVQKRDVLTSFLLKRDFSKQDIIRSGLAFLNENGLVDIYYHRIMFPIWNQHGQIVGYSGRVYDSSDTSKYINTKETEIFKKSEILYHYHQAKQLCRQVGKVIVMEGFMDVIRASTIGIDNTVATMGTAITSYQANLMKRMAKEIILCFDGDEAGLKATVRCINEFEKIGVQPKVIHLEDQMDPDDYIKTYGKDAFLSKVDHALNVLDFKLWYLKKGKDLRSPRDLAEYVNQLIPELNQLEDDVLRQITIQKISEETGLDRGFINDRLATPTKKTVVIQKSPVPRGTNKYQKAEQQLLYYMLLHKEVIAIYQKHTPFLPTKEYRLLAREVCHVYEKYGTINIADVMTHLQDQPELLKLVGEVSMLSLKGDYTNEEIEDYIRVIAEYNIKQETKRLEQLIKQETDSMKKVVIAEQIVQLKIGDRQE